MHENKQQIAPPTTETYIQPEMEIGEEQDEYEMEANAVADSVVGMSSSGEGEDSPKMSTGGSDIKKMSASSSLQRMVDPKTDQPKMMDTSAPIRRMSEGSKGGMKAPQSVERGIQRAKGGGQSLPAQTQNEMGGVMNTDLGGVKVHTDDKAAEMNQQIGSKAFTHGNDIFFNQGQYQPQTKEGKHLLAHEATHTVQQSGKVQPKIQRRKEDDPKQIKKQYKKPEELAKHLLGLLLTKKTEKIKDLEEKKKKHDPEFVYLDAGTSGRYVRIIYAVLRELSKSKKRKVVLLMLEKLSTKHSSILLDDTVFYDRLIQIAEFKEDEAKTAKKHRSKLIQNENQRRKDFGIELAKKIGKDTPAVEAILAKIKPVEKRREITYYMLKSLYEKDKEGPLIPFEKRVVADDVKTLKAWGNPDLAPIYSKVLIERGVVAKEDKIKENEKIKKELQRITDLADFQSKRNKIDIKTGSVSMSLEDLQKIFGVTGKDDFIFIKGQKEQAKVYMDIEDGNIRNVPNALKFGFRSLAMFVDKPPDTYELEKDEPQFSFTFKLDMPNLKTSDTPEGEGVVDEFKKERVYRFTSHGGKSSEKWIEGLGPMKEPSGDSVKKGRELFMDAGFSWVDKEEKVEEKADSGKKYKVEYESWEKKESEKELIYKALSKLPKSLLDSIGSIRFKRAKKSANDIEREKNKTSTDKSNIHTQAYYSFNDKDGHSMTFVDDAFKGGSSALETVFGDAETGFSTQLERTLVHELGHAVDLNPIRARYKDVEKPPPKKVNEISISFDGSQPKQDGTANKLMFSTLDNYYEQVYKTEVGQNRDITFRLYRVCVKAYNKGVSLSAALAMVNEEIDDTNKDIEEKEKKGLKSEKKKETKYNTIQEILGKITNRNAADRLIEAFKAYKVFIDLRYSTISLSGVEKKSSSEMEAAPEGKKHIGWMDRDAKVDSDFQKAAKVDTRAVDRITDYSEDEDSWTEFFAETFSLYFTDPQRLKALRPNLYYYFEDKYKHWEKEEEKKEE